MPDPTSTASNKLQDENPTLGWMYEQITGDEDARVCKDIPDTSCQHLPRNFFAYLFANLLSKLADELSSARLILPWLLGVLGAPATFTGFLVPIREAGVLVPQLFIAAYIRRLAIRKGVWLLGAGLSAGALLLMAVSVQNLQGSAAGWSIILLITVYSVARGFCSVSAKDVLGKTVSKTRRGVLMGYSASIAGVLTLALGFYINNLGQQADVDLLVVMLLAAAGIWVVAMVIFAVIREAPGATENGGNAFATAVKSMGILFTDAGFRQFVIARTLLLSIALAPPFYVLLAQQHSSGVVGLGLLIIASGLAGSLSAPVWGKLSDRSSRWVMVIAAGLAGTTGIITWLLDRTDLAMMHSIWTYAVLFFLIAVFHGGVRLGRKVYLVDMATTENRSTYVAVSNTVIGVAILAGGLFGVIGDLFSTGSTIAILGLLSIIAALYIARIPEVSG